MPKHLIYIDQVIIRLARASEKGALGAVLCIEIDPLLEPAWTCLISKHRA